MSHIITAILIQIGCSLLSLIGASPDVQAVEMVLRQFVPGFYLLAGLYLAFTAAQLRHAMAFGVVGMVAYITLNDPEWYWLPVWVGHEQWVIITLLSILGVGIWLFWLIIDREGISWPWHYLVAAWQWIRERFD